MKYFWIISLFVLPAIICTFSNGKRVFHFSMLINATRKKTFINLYVAREPSQ